MQWMESDGISNPPTLAGSPELSPPGYQRDLAVNDLETNAKFNPRTHVVFLKLILLA